MFSWELASSSCGVSKSIAHSACHPSCCPWASQSLLNGPLALSWATAQHCSDRAINPVMNVLETGCRQEPHLLCSQHLTPPPLLFHRSDAETV